MRSGIFIWTVANDYGARIPDDDSQGAMSVALFKVADGLNQMQTVPQAIALAKQYRDQDIDMYPWGVAQGWSLDVARSEGALAGQYAAAVGRPHILDLEPYKAEGYWQGISGTPAAFIEGYGSTANGQPLRLCPDARNVGINLEEWVALLPGAIWHPQAYYTAFGSHDYKVGINSAIKPLLNAGVPKSQIYPVLPLWLAQTGEPSIPAKDLNRDIDYLAAEGYPGAAWWRRGRMSPDHVTLMKAKTDPFPHAPDPEPEPPAQTPKQVALAHIEAARIAVEALP